MATYTHTFKNIHGMVVAVTDPTMAVWALHAEPGTSPFITVEADATLELGEYEAELDVTSLPSGSYRVRWSGVVGGRTIHNVSSILVDNEDLPAGPGPREELLLIENSIYELTVSVALEDDSTIDSSCRFTSRYIPMCSTYDDVVALLYGMVSILNPDMINYLIWQISKEANNEVPDKVCDEVYLAHACNQYVKYRVAVSLARNLLSSGSVLRKSLGDFLVTYADTSPQLQLAIKLWDEEVKAWQRVLNAGACITYGQSLPMGTAHASLYNADRPPIGRRIMEPVGSLIAANTKYRVGNRVRYQHGYYRARRHPFDD